MARTNPGALLGMLAETPVHAGTGSDLGYVDLPIQRERATQFPTIHGSGVKGVLRDLARRVLGDGMAVEALFGSEPPQGPGGDELTPGAFAFSDAKLLLMPCRTAGPVFAWVTSPYLLERFRRDREAVGLSPSLPAVPEVAEDQALVGEKSRWRGDRVLIEDFEFRKQASPALDKYVQAIQGLLPAGPEYRYWREELVVQALVVVSDDNLKDLALHGTEVVTRVRLDPRKKTVAEGALWTEEYLPQDALLYSVVTGLSREDGGGPGDLFGKLRTLIGGAPVAQFGGKETVGRGFMALRLVETGGVG